MKNWRITKSSHLATLIALAIIVLGVSGYFGISKYSDYTTDKSKQAELSKKETALEMGIQYYTHEQGRFPAKKYGNPECIYNMKLNTYLCSNFVISYFPEGTEVTNEVVDMLSQKTILIKSSQNEKTVFLGTADDMTDWNKKYEALGFKYLPGSIPITP